MKTQRLLLLIFTVSLFSCSSKHHEKEATTETPQQQPQSQPEIKQELKPGEVVPSLACSSDATQSFALYLPKDYSTSKKFPVIIFFDPHGSGAYPVGLFKSLADKFGFILMGSNDSKNGVQFDQSNVIAANLINEASSRFSVDAKRISFAGFSGGSKVAQMGASVHPELLSLIYCGASLPIEKLQQLPPALGFAGVRDMNYTEVIASGAALDAKKATHCIIEWKGKHEWPDSLSFEDAFYWCSFNAMRIKTVETDHALVNSFLQRENKLIASAKNSIAQHDLNLRVVNFLEGIADVSSYKQKISAIAQSEAYKKEIQKQQAMLQTEGNLKQNYMQCFENKDLKWWKEEVARMHSMEKGEQEMMYQRLLGYLSLASYSYSNNAIRQNDFTTAQRYLDIYQVADPENSEQRFLSACLYARQGDQGKAIASLQEAVQLGLKDKAKIQNEESFNSLRSNPEFSKLLNGIN